jgi:hypothetical protein
MQERLLDLLEEYSNTRKEKEQERKRQRVRTRSTNTTTSGWIGLDWVE